MVAFLREIAADMVGIAVDKVDSVGRIAEEVASIVVEHTRSGIEVKDNSPAVEVYRPDIGLQEALERRTVDQT